MFYLRSAGFTAIQVAALFAAASISACMPRYTQRQTLVLDPAQGDDYSIRYGELEGCLVRQQVPLLYSVQRPAYKLSLRVLPSTGGEAPAIEVVVEGSGGVNVRFPDLPTQRADEQQPQRTVIPVNSLPVPSLKMELLRGSEFVGSETIAVRQRSCSALLL